MTCWKCDPITDATPFDMSDVALPISLPHPTITVFKSDLVRFNESLKYVQSIVTALVGNEKWSRFDVAGWFINNGTDEQIASLRGELRDDTELLLYMASTSKRTTHD